MNIQEKLLSKIIGNKEDAIWGYNLPAGNKVCFINYQAIYELPDQYDSLVTTITFDLNKDFTPMGNGKYLPTVDLMYKIADACGISGLPTSKVEPFTEEIDINPMLAKSIEEEPTFRKMKTGVIVTKQAKILKEDGTYLESSPCSNIYNVWDRCCEMWSKEEKKTNGYANNNAYGKYKTRYDRKSHFDSEMKFAHAKAETKAYCKCIRELAGLPTAFDSFELQNGKLIFSRVVRSKKSLQLEQAAHLSAISKGFSNNEVPQLLFGEEEEQEYQQEDVIRIYSLVETLEAYKSYIDEPTSLDGAINWLKENDYKLPENKAGADKARKLISEIEKTLTTDKILRHE